MDGVVDTNIGYEMRDDLIARTCQLTTNGLMRREIDWFYDRKYVPSHQS